MGKPRVDLRGVCLSASQGTHSDHAAFVHVHLVHRNGYGMVGSSHYVRKSGRQNDRCRANPIHALDWPFVG